MKVGDKVICKRNVCYHFEAAGEYEISYIDGGHIFVAYGDNDFDYNCFHLNDNIVRVEDYTYKDDTVYIFGKYFITESEIRREKIKKIEYESR